MERPRFSKRWTVHSSPPDRLLLAGETSETFLHSGGLAVLAPLADGSCDMRALSAATATSLSPPELWFAVADGRGRGLLKDAAEDEEAPPERQAFWDRVGTSERQAGAALAGLRVGVTALGGIDPAPFRNALRRSKITLVEAGEAAGKVGAATFQMVVTDDYLRPELLGVADRLLRERRSWMPVRPVGAALWIGPIYHGAETACHRCLADRLRRHREVGLFVEAKAGRPLCELVRPSSAPASLSLAASLATLELVRWTSGEWAETLRERVMTVDLATGAMATHRLTRRPQCTACGTPVAAPSPHLVARPKDMPADVEATSLARLKRLVGPVTGVVTDCYRLGDPARPGIHNFVAVHSFPMVRENIDVLAENRIGRSGGTGTSQEEAEISALGEAVERISGIWRGEEEARVRTSMAALGEAAIDLGGCLLYSDAQYASATDWNARQTAPRELVPRRIDPDEMLDFTPVRAVRGGEPRYLPTSYCYYGHPEAADPVCYADSNGCAGGPSFEAAAASALIELAERDAVAIWWYNRIARPAVEIASFGLDFTAQIEASFARAGRDLVVLDLSNDLGIPVFAGVSRRLDHGREEILLGFGAHLDAASALKRVLRELNQFAFIAAERDAEGHAILKTGNADMRRWLTQATLADHPHLAPTLRGTRTAAEFPRLSSDDHRDDVTTLADRFAAVGVEAVLLDQTRPDIGSPVVRAIAPGLRHFWRRLAPGRLYDVPVKLGWRDAALAEADMNPQAVFF